MIVEAVESKFFGTNTYIVGCLTTRKAAIIDPSGKARDIETLVKKWNLTVEYIINTHSHVDHIWLNARFKRLFGAKIAIHELDAHALNRIRLYLLPFGRLRLSPPADLLLKDRDILKVGSLELEVIHTPGHSKGSACYRCQKKLFTGDTLMAGEIGRVNLKNNDLEILLHSIKEKLLVLSDDITVYPGHGPKTTIETERKYNPFLRKDEKWLKEFLKNPVKVWKQNPHRKQDKSV